MAESLYGIDNHLIERACSKMPKEFIDILNNGYRNIKDVKNKYR